LRTEPIIISKNDIIRDCPCGRDHSIDLDQALIADDAAFAVEELLRGSGFSDNVAVIYDENTYEALQGKRPKARQEIILPPENLHANEHGVGLAEAQLKDVDYLIAAGSGTVHDITRYICGQRGLSFGSMPTAASVDGFVSSVAAMTLKGFKVTVPSVSPKFMAADLKVIADAPRRLTASGFGDVLGKFVSLTDWAIGHAITGEYHCDYTANLTNMAVEETYRAVDGIEAGERAAYGSLMKALVLSGLAMKLSGNSRPASGAEHHVSHLIEIGTPWLPEVDALHGEKVGIGTLLALKTYRSKIGTKPDELMQAAANWKTLNADLLEPIFGILTEEILAENKKNCLDAVTPEGIANGWEQVQQLLCKLPSEEEVRKVLKQIGGLTTLDEIGIDPALQDKILTWSPLVRNRLTFMRLLNVLPMTV